MTIRGHRTSISLEVEFWTALEKAAAARRLTLPLLIAEIDAERLRLTPAPGLASALRLFALGEAERSAMGGERG
jgi:predicted DNA-binding ribbon-helix-helix protein